MTNSHRWNPLPRSVPGLVLQLVAVAAVLGLIWFIDPLGWRQPKAQAPVLPSPTASTLGQIEALQARLSDDPADTRTQVELASLYLLYVRESSDPSYYNKADGLLKQALAANAEDQLALVQMGTLALARHDFHGALAWGEKAKAVNPSHWLTYGIIGDANVELGNYEAAQTSFDKMATLRPDINSYSRISYMRELLGDRQGAIQAMTMASRVGPQNTEPSNWARVQLANLYFNSGQLDQAEALYQMSLKLYPGYLHALAGMGKVRAARGDYNGSILYYQQALREVPFPEYVIALGDVMAAAGKPDEAQKQYALVSAIQQLYAANGVDSDLEIALFNADHGIAAEQTLVQARAAYERRPSIFAADVLAWALYQTGNYAEAQTFSEKALHLGMQDAIKYYHAGMIALKLNQTEQARTFLKKAIDINPHFSVLYAEQAKATLQQLQ